MTKLHTLLAIAAAFLPTSKPTGCREKRQRERLTCGSLHTHNNAFCSAKCCKEYDRDK